MLNEEPVFARIVGLAPLLFYFYMLQEILVIYRHARWLDMNELLNAGQELNN